MTQMALAKLRLKSTRIGSNNPQMEQMDAD